jgi:hypothetical protein
MPAAFMACTQAGGKVRRVSGPSKEHHLKANEYVDYCTLEGKSYRGHVHTKKKD